VHVAAALATLEGQTVTKIGLQAGFGHSELSFIKNEKLRADTSHSKKRYRPTALPPITGCQR
jgi:hypothetical protein